MPKKNKKNRIGTVYSTNPDFEYIHEHEEEKETLPPSQQKLYIQLDKKQRGGKKVTLIEGFYGSDADLQELGKTLKRMIGVGGACKEGNILIQGDFRDRIMAFLLQKGYNVKRKG